MINASLRVASSGLDLLSYKFRTFPNTCRIFELASSDELRRVRVSDRNNGREILAAERLTQCLNRGAARVHVVLVESPSNVRTVRCYREGDSRIRGNAGQVSERLLRTLVHRRGAKTNRRPDFRHRLRAGTGATRHRSTKIPGIGLLGGVRVGLGRKVEVLELEPPSGRVVDGLPDSVFRGWRIRA